jgi:Fic family protein
MVAAATALAGLVNEASLTGIGLDAIGRAHRALFAHDPAEARTAGNLREVQNWIGGSDHSPRGALYVPPPPDRVSALMEDLVAFAARRDLPTIAAGAIIHAQFESIHPFTDGNGRIGRALINATFRARGLTHHTPVPVAPVMAADTPAYFEALDRYREGDVEGIGAYVGRAVSRGAHEAAISGALLEGLPARWTDTVRPRRHSAVAKLIHALPENPALDAVLAARLTGASESSTYEALDRLAETGILVPLTASARHRVWGVADVLAEVDDLQERLAAPEG